MARLEALAAEGHLDADILAILGRAWTSLGISLGTILPEERLTVAVQWTAKGVAAAGQLGQADVLAEALAMHGNELRKDHQPSALPVLERAVSTTAPGPGRGMAMALLARVAVCVGDAHRFTAAITSCHDLMQRHGPVGPLLHPFTLREIHIRGLLELGAP